MNNSFFDYKIIIFAQNLWKSQLARYDFFTDIVFVVVCCQRGYLLIAKISAIVMVINLLLMILKMLAIGYKKYLKKYRQLKEKR